MKGRIEEAAGVLAGSEKPRRQGRRNQEVGRAKQAADEAIDRVARRMRD